tara:strand:- start:5886 stop:6437 length:552 start_codon:yes stop_codon:yes gene_type:complete
VQFSWIEFASNTGYVAFQGGSSEANGGAQTYWLATSNPAGAPQLSSTGWADIDFDFTFKRPMTAQAADALVTFTTNINNGAQGQVTVKLYHVRGAVETQLGATFVCENHNNAGANNRAYRNCATITPTAEQVFKVGDKIRVNVTEANNVGLYHDPSNGAIAAGTDNDVGAGTQFILNMPFKIT